MLAPFRDGKFDDFDALELNPNMLHLFESLKIFHHHDYVVKGFCWSSYPK